MKIKFAIALIACTAAMGLPACAAQEASVSASEPAQVVAPRCNLKLDWNAAAQRYEAVYQGPALFASATDVPRTHYVADQACSVGQIVDWQEAVEDGSDVCQFAWRYTSTGMVDVFACVRIERIS